MHVCVDVCVCDQLVYRLHVSTTQIYCTNHPVVQPHPTTHQSI